MALETKQEKLADILTRLHQDALELDTSNQFQRQAYQDFMNGRDHDLSVGGVPAQTFMAGDDGTHWYAGFHHMGEWFIGVVAFVHNERSVNVDNPTKGILVAAIPAEDDDHILATLRSIKMNLTRQPIAKRPTTNKFKK